MQHQYQRCTAFIQAAKRAEGTTLNTLEERYDMGWTYSTAHISPAFARAQTKMMQYAVLSQQNMRKNPFER